MDFVIEPIAPIIPAHLPPEQYDPFIIGAQALQIPHLDEPFTRRSVEVQPTFINQLPTFERSSSVKITKYDNQPTRLLSIKPKLVRINTVLKKDQDGQTKKTCIKTTPPSGTIDFYLCPPPPTTSSNSSNSSLADGSITVFWEQQPSS
ncbi:hypothetical protein INT48_002911 [Thamnidium elegans]|uniref:Uncharacterized protein n=1 Tax=Thamnidium elegans TaxID=101142 RepID=A0A8H7VU53_9FUNG|nr:hypothetical protein INT48_002911 [Thamnidium elegans]